MSVAEALFGNVFQKETPMHDPFFTAEQGTELVRLFNSFASAMPRMIATLTRLERARKKLWEENRWRAMEDEPPVGYCRVLAVWGTSQATIVNVRDGHYFEGVEEEFEVNPPTHWRPLPLPPGVKDEKPVTESTEGEGGEG